MKTWNITKPDIIIHNAYLHTVDKDDSILEAIAITNNKILAVGSNEEIMTLADTDTKLIDAKKNSVIPGIIDTHNHTWGSGEFLEGVVLFGVSSMEELRTAIANKLKDMKEGEWLECGCWIETQFKENRMPTKYDIDEVSPNNPVMVDRILEVTVVNSYVLELAGITKETPDPKDGKIYRDPITGEPNGILHGTARGLISGLKENSFGINRLSIDLADMKKIEENIIRTSKEYIKYGITSVVEPGVSPVVMRSYQNLRKNNELIIRTNLMPIWHGYITNDDVDYLNKKVDHYGIYTGFGDEWLSIGALKAAIDGGLTSRTALKSWLYKGETEKQDVPVFLDLNKLDETIKRAHDAGWSVGTHVMGDIAIEKIVDAIYKAYKQNPVKRRHSIIHAYYPTEDSLKKMAEAGIIAALQPSFIYNEADGYGDLLPEDKINSYMPMRKYLNYGVIIVSGTDMPSAHYNPFWNMYSAVVRKGLLGFQLGTEESITIEEMLRTMTINGAYYTEEDDIKGSLEPGKLADIAILDRCLANVTDEEIKDINVDYTILDGNIIFSK